MSRRSDERARDSVLYRLSGDPGASLSDRSTHHGARVLLLVALAVLVTALFPPTHRPQVARFEVGTVASEDIIAEIPFSVPKSAEELEREQNEAMSAIPRTFEERFAAGDSVAERLGRFFDRLDSAATAGDTIAVQTILRDNRINVTAAQMRFVLNDDARSSLRRAGQEAAREIIPQGMADPAELSAVSTEVIYVRSGDGAEQARAVAEVITSRDFYARAMELLPPTLPPDAQDLLRLILISRLEYSLVPDVVATEADLAAARNSVTVTKGEVLEGEAIVRAAQAIGPETLERLEAYESALRTAGLAETEQPVATALIGSLALTFMLLSIFGLLLYFSRPQVYANYRWLLLLAILSAAYFGAARGIVQAGLPSEWLPIAFVALPTAVLWDTRMSVVLVLVLAAITGTLAPFQGEEAYGTVLVVMAMGAAAAMSVRAIRRRSETWVSIAIVSAAAIAVGLAFALATGQDLDFMEVVRSSLAITGNATVSALLAVGFLWLFELLTGITTDQTLLEWADPTRPLLRKLSMEAPGTYAHTINVANLAEAAANAIGANGLLCRVGVLYHDVGKMLKPHYFVENQPDERNPHDKLKPETSASIVREHVTEGVRLAKEAKVPGIVSQFILEHHGTQRIGFFYEKARQENEGDVDPSRFAYPGPKPQSKETAIVMLADSCESATRAMQDSTPERVRDLIDTVVDTKIEEGQLDEAPLTLAEVSVIKSQFAKILGGVVHRRIEYPETKHLTDATAEGDRNTGEDRRASRAAAPDGSSSDDASPSESKASEIGAGPNDEPTDASRVDASSEDGSTDRSSRTESRSESG